MNSGVKIFRMIIAVLPPTCTKHKVSDEVRRLLQNYGFRHGSCYTSSFGTCNVESQFFFLSVDSCHKASRHFIEIPSGKF